MIIKIIIIIVLVTSHEGLKLVQKFLTWSITILVVIDPSMYDWIRPTYVVSEPGNMTTVGILVG